VTADVSRRPRSLSHKECQYQPEDETSVQHRCAPTGGDHRTVSFTIVTLQNFLYGEALLALSEAPGTGYLKRLVDASGSTALTQCTTCFNTNSAICLQCIYGFCMILKINIHYFSK